VALVPLSSVDPSALRWIRTQDSPPAFSLRSGDAEVAVLTWDRPGGSLATARSAETTWTLKRVGFLQPSILVRLAGAPGPVARLSAHLARHEITLPNEPSYRLRRAGHFVPSWRLTTSEGAEVLHVEPVPENRALQGGAVVVSPQARPASALLLVVLSWYFVVLSWFEDEAIEALTPFEGPDAPISLRRTG